MTTKRKYKKKSYKKKSWWKKHWDEVLFLTAICLAIYFILRGTGYI